MALDSIQAKPVSSTQEQSIVVKESKVSGATQSSLVWISGLPLIKVCANCLILCPLAATPSENPHGSRYSTLPKQ